MCKQELYRCLEKLDIAKQALQEIVENNWGGPNSDLKVDYLFCHPEGCDSPEIARAALKEMEK